MTDEEESLQIARRVIGKYGSTDPKKREEAIADLARKVLPVLRDGRKPQPLDPDPRSPVIRNAERIEERERRKVMLAAQEAQLMVEDYLRDHPEAVENYLAHHPELRERFEKLFGHHIEP
jgi:hypothetical protein